VVIDNDELFTFPAQAVPCRLFKPGRQGLRHDHSKAMQGIGGLSQGSLMKGFLDRSMSYIYRSRRHENRWCSHPSSTRPRPGYDANKNASSSTFTVEASRLLAGVRGAGSIPVAALGRIKVSR